MKFQDEYSDNYIQKILEVIKNDNFNVGNLKSLLENLLGEEIKNETSKNSTIDSSIDTEKEIGLKGNKTDKVEKEKAKADKLIKNRAKPSKFNAD